MLTASVIYIVGIICKTHPKIWDSNVNNSPPLTEAEWAVLQTEMVAAKDMYDALDAESRTLFSLLNRSDPVVNYDTADDYDRALNASHEACIQLEMAISALEEAIRCVFLRRERLRLRAQNTQAHPDAPEPDIPIEGG